MNTIDVRTEMRKLASSKPVHAAAGAGMLATEALRELPARLAKWRNEANVTSLSTRATEYVTTARARAVGEYEKLAKRGKKALNGGGTSHGKGALNGKGSHPRTTTKG
jgi:hypothetical protein